MTIALSGKEILHCMIFLCAAAVGIGLLGFPFQLVSLIVLTLLLMLAIASIEMAFIVMIVALPLSYALPALHLGLIDLRVGYLLNFFIFLSLFLKIMVLKKGKWVRTELDVPILVFITVNFISVLVSPDPLWSFKESIQYIYYFMIYFTIVNIVQDRSLLKQTVRVFLGISFIVALIGLLQFMIGFQLPKIDIYMPLGGGISSVAVTYPELEYKTGFLLYKRISAFFFHHNGLANFLLAGLMISMALSHGQKEKIKKWAYVIAAVITGVAIILTYSRGAWMGAAGAFLCLTFLQKKSLRSNLFFLMFFLLLFSLSATLKTRFTEMSNMSETSTVGHLYLLKVGLNIVKQHPLLGIGCGAFQVAADRFMAITPGPSEMFYGWGSDVKRVLIHNVFLQIWTETGTIGLASFLWIIIRYARLSLKTVKNIKDRFWQALLIGVFVSVIAILIQNLTITFLIEHFWALLALTMVIIRIAPIDRTKRIPAGELS